MRTRILLLAAATALAGGCANPRQPQAAPGASRVGAPDPRVDATLAGRGSPAEAAPRTAPPSASPTASRLPASYRLMLLDGHLELVRETDPQEILRAPATLRLVAGELARGELAYQPGPPAAGAPAEVAANRESSARMDNALEEVMRRSRELSDRRSPSRSSRASSRSFSPPPRAGCASSRAPQLRLQPTGDKQALCILNVAINRDSRDESGEKMSKTRRIPLALVMG